MILKDLIDKVNLNDVLDYLKISDDEKYIESYKKMFCKLKEMTPTFNCDLSIFVVEQKDYLDESIYYEVLGKRVGDNERYALDFIPWSDWLGCTVVEKSIELFGEVLFVAECLHEMSFISFNEEDIKNELDNLVEIENRIKEGNEKFYTFEEVVEHLNDEFDLNYEIKEKSVEEEKERERKTKEIFEFNMRKIDEIWGNI